VNNNRWSFTASWKKGNSRCYKDADGTMHVVGVASDDLEDRAHERISEKAIKAIARQANKSHHDVLDHHASSFSIGQISEANIKKSKTKSSFIIDVVLKDEYPQARELFKEVQSGNSDKQLSIGGFINLDNEKAIEWEDGKDGRVIRVVNDLLLDHIAVTRKDMAANPRTKFRTAIVKSIDFDGLEDNYKNEDGEKSMKKDKGKEKKEDKDDEKVKDENKDIEKKEDKDDEVVISKDEKLVSVVELVIEEMSEIHKSEDNSLTEDQINNLKKVHGLVEDFLKLVDSQDDDVEDDDNDDDKDDNVSEKLDELKKSFDITLLKVGENVAKAFKAVNKEIEGLKKAGQRSGRIKDEDDDEEDDDENNVFKGLLEGSFVGGRIPAVLKTSSVVSDD